MNAFFQLEMKEDGIYLILFPETDGGSSFDIKEIYEYLDKQKVEYERSTVISAISGLNVIKKIKLNSLRMTSVNESMSVNIDSEKTKAIGRFYPPSSGGKRMSIDDILDYLSQNGIKFGINEESIMAFLKKPDYCTNYVVAMAKSPVEGKSAVITYYFNTDLSKKPQTNEDGSVDFHKLDNISSIEKGAVLAKLEPAVQGQPGMNIFGKPIMPHKVVNKILRYGRNIHLSEDGCIMYSDVSGHAMLVDDKVFVEDTYEVGGDVDVSTGDITFEGNVHIKGSVRTGYSVTAKGDIVVDDVVEGATITAGGQIILKRGIQGMTKGSLNADSNIITKFIENAIINAGGYVATDAILHSKVTAKGDIIVNGKKGFITGGEIRSGTMIFAKTAGSSMGTNTLLEVGADPGLLDEYRRLEKEVPNIQAEIDKIVQILTLFAKKIRGGEKLPTDKLLYIKTLTQGKEDLENKIVEIENKLNRLESIIESNDSGCVKIGSMIYPGCRVVISNVVYFVRTEMSHCRLVRDRADIRVAPL